MPRVGVLSPGDPPPRDAFRQQERFEAGLRELGWQPGADIVVEYRYAEGRLDRLPAMAAELASLPVDVIVARGLTIAPARQATATIPIVMAADPDPVRSGFVASLARPGGNITGLTTQALDSEAKQLELLRGALPALTRVAVLTNPNSPIHGEQLQQTEAAARALGLELTEYPISGPDQLSGVFERMSRAKEGAALFRGTLWFLDAPQVATLVLKHRMPSVHNLREFPQAGALMSYGVNFAELHRRAAAFVDRILKGANPAELPVEQPTTYEFFSTSRLPKPSASRSHPRSSPAPTRLSNEAAGVYPVGFAPLAAVVRPRLASAQARTPRIGLLAPGSSATTAEFVQELKAGLREHGLVDGENVHLEPAFGETHQALDDLAVQLVRSNVSLIIAWSTPAVAAAKRATGTIPIVMVGIADPIGARLVESLARPGGNVTGTTNLSRDLGGKILDFLLQIVPQVRRLGILLNPSNEAASLQLRDTEVAAHALGLELHVAHAATASDIGTAVEKLVAERASALVVLPDPLYAAERARLGELALAHRLPSAFSRRENAQAGALLSYGPNLGAQFRRSAGYAAKILRGAAPADLPVEQPTHLELVLNLRTAKALQLSIAPSLLIRADEVIE